MIPTRVGRAIVATVAMVPSVVLLHAYANGPDTRGDIGGVSANPGLFITVGQ